MSEDFEDGPEVKSAYEWAREENVDLKEREEWWGIPALHLMEIMTREKFLEIIAPSESSERLK